MRTQTYRLHIPLRRQRPASIWAKRLQARLGIVVAAVILMASPFVSLWPSFRHYRLADNTGMYAASGVIGEFHAVGGAYSNFVEPTNQYGMGPGNEIVDTVHHRLFVDDGSNGRILIYNLDSSNNLTGTTADYVLGQPDLTTETDSFTGQPITQNHILCSDSIAYDSTNDRLFVGDQCESRVLVFDLSGGITDDMNASYVLGEPDFTTGFSLGNGESDSQSTIRDPVALDFDTSSQQLFVADYNGNRILIFDLSGGITDGMNASHVLGEPDFTTQQNNGSPTINSSLTLTPNGIAYDAANKRLFVTDSQNDGVAGIFGGRVLVYDLSGGITDGMAASNVLGQPDFTSDSNALTQSGMTEPGMLLYDSATSRLFVSDSGNNRDLVFDLSGGITDGMNASNVLGEPDFTSHNAANVVDATTYTAPNGFGYDPTNQRLYLSDDDARVLTLDLSGGLSDDMSPTSVMGQTDFSGNPTYTGGGFNDEGHFINQWANLPAGSYTDTVNHRLYIADGGFDRVMVYNLDANDNMTSPQAAYVLGEPDFLTTTAGSSTTQSSITCPEGVAGDAARSLLFVLDGCSNRVLVYDLSGGITNGMNAAYVLGQTDFTSSGSGTSQTTFGSDPLGLAYDPNSKYLYVGDESNARVMVFDTTTLSDGMNAAYVIGQPDFASNTASVSQNGLSTPYGVAVDPARHELFVADWGSAGRVMIYDTSALSDGMNATNELGETDFTSSNSAADTFGTPDAKSFAPSGLAYDDNNQRLFVEDSFADRVMAFDLSGGITNGMSANGVIGQPDFTSSTQMSVPSKYQFYYPYGFTDAYDTLSNQLYLSDTYDGRVMIYAFANLVSVNSSPTVGDSYSQVLGDQTQGTVSYALTSGSVPPGLNFNSGTGLLSGSVTTPGSYSFTVQITDDNGTLGTYTDSKTYNINVSAPGDNIPPSDPSGLTANLTTNTNAHLSWTASTDNVGVTGYQIIRNGIQIATTAGTTYDDTPLSDGTTYTYTVRAYDAANNVSGDSNQASVNTADTTPPSAPAGLSAQATSSASVALAWNASTDNVGVTGYHVLRDNSLVATVSGATLAYTDNTVSPSTTYTYTVTAFDAAANVSTSSNAALVSTPAAPTSPPPSGGSQTPAKTRQRSPAKPSITHILPARQQSAAPVLPSQKVIDLDQQPAFTDGSGYIDTSGGGTVYRLNVPARTSSQAAAYTLTLQSVISSSSGGGSHVAVQVQPLVTAGQGGTVGNGQNATTSTGASVVPRTVTIAAGREQLVDINGDGRDDIGIEVVSVKPATGSSPAVATIKFWKLTAAVTKPQVQAGSSGRSRGNWFGNVLDDLTRLVSLLPNIVIYLFPYLLFVLLAIEAAVLFKQAARELYEYRKLEQLVARAKAVDEAKKTYIQLASHYLRTPVTVLLAGADLLASGPSGAPQAAEAVRAIGTEIRTGAESLIKQAAIVDTPTAVGELAAEPYGNRLWRQPIVFVPVVLNLFVWIAFVYLANRAEKLSFAQVDFGVQVIVFSIVVVLLYRSLRNRQLRRRDRQSLDRILGEQDRLNQSRDQLIADTLSMLQNCVGRLGKLTAGLGESPMTKPIANGEKNLRQLLDKFVMAEHLRGGYCSADFSETALNVLLRDALDGLPDSTQRPGPGVALVADAEITVQQPELLTYVLMTVISNALAYSKTNPQIDIAGNADNSGQTITVIDHGSGIAQDKLAALFEPFSKAEGALLFTHEGMGFSLYLDKLIMAYLGGDIAIRSEPGHGTAVTLHLPAVSPDRQHSPGPAGYQLRVRPA